MRKQTFSRRDVLKGSTALAIGTLFAEPVRAAAPSENPGVLWQDASIAGFGDNTAFGGYTGVAAAGGAVYPLWIDTRDIGGNREEVFASVIRR